jgi:hypothetical protein
MALVNDRSNIVGEVPASFASLYPRLACCAARLSTLLPQLSGSPPSCAPYPLRSMRFDICRCSLFDFSRPEDDHHEPTYAKRICAFFSWKCEDPHDLLAGSTDQRAESESRDILSHLSAAVCQSSRVSGANPNSGSRLMVRHWGSLYPAAGRMRGWGDWHPAAEFQPRALRVQRWFTGSVFIGLGMRWAIQR